MVVYIFLFTVFCYLHVYITAIAYESGFYSLLGNTPGVPSPHNPKLKTTARLPFHSLFRPSDRLEHSHLPRNVAGSIVGRSRHSDGGPRTFLRPPS